MATVQEDRVGRDGHSEAHRAERSLTDLIKELRDETTLLIREEVELAKTEMSEKVSRVSRNGGYLAGGGLFAFAGLIVLLLAASAGLYVGLVAAGLANAIAGWLAPLIVGGIAVAIGYAFMQKAITTLKHESAVPERTVQTMKDDKNWMKGKVSR